MTFRKTSIALLLCAAVSTTTIAAPPEGKGKGGGGGGEDPPAVPFEPEILYRYDGNKDTDLRFGNLAGDQAKLVHRGGVTHFNLSSDSTRRIVYVDGDTLYVRTWQTADPSASFVSAPQVIYQGDRPTTMDFSPDDRWLVFNDGARDLYIYDFNDGTWEKVLDLPADYFVHNLRWSPEGDAVFFYGGPGDYVGRGIRRVDVSGYVADKSNPVGQPTLIMESGVDFSGTAFTISQPQSGATPMIVAVDQPEGGVLTLYDLTGTKIARMPWAVGAWWSFNCSNSMGVYQVSNSWRNTDLVISDLFGSTSTWAADNKIYQRAEWLPKTGC